MIAEMRQAFGTGKPREETVFDVEFTEEHVIDGVFCQVQFEVRPRDGAQLVRSRALPREARRPPRLVQAHDGIRRRRGDRRGARNRAPVDRSRAVGRLRGVGRGDVLRLARPPGDGARVGAFDEGRPVLLPAVLQPDGRLPEMGSVLHGLHGGVRRVRGSFRPASAVAEGGDLVRPVLQGDWTAWPATMATARMCFKGCAGLTGAWTDDPALLMPDAMNGWQGTTTAHDEAVAEAGDGLRALFYADWGGTRARPAE